MDKAMDTWKNEKKMMHMFMSICMYVCVCVCVCVCIQLVTQSCQSLCNPMECNPPESSVHEISLARILE